MKYPKECFSAVRQQTFCIVDGLTRVGFEDDEEPLKIHHPKFSRFIMTVINTEKKSAAANIRAGEDLPDITVRSKFAYQKEMELSMSGKSTTSPAYTVRFTSGIMQGKTPAEVLLHDSNATELLNNQYKWLKQNVKKYPKNQLQMDAIVDASKLMKEGKLSDDQLVKSLCLYSTNGPRPNMYKEREDKTYPVYEMTIDWNFMTEYPICVHITNYFAPVIKNQDGTINVQKKNAKDVVNNSFTLTAKEWMKAIDIMNANKRIFEDNVGPSCRKAAADGEKTNREEYMK